MEMCEEYEYDFETIVNGNMKIECNVLQINN